MFCCALLRVLSFLQYLSLVGKRERYDLLCLSSWRLVIVIVLSLFFTLPCVIEVLFDFSPTVKAAPHECVIRTGQP